jgi:ArsR family transcriptional regulator
MAFDEDDIILAQRIKALGHPARLAIVRALVGAPDGACRCRDIVRNLPLAQSTVSQHLKVLLDAGIIRGEVEGPKSCYWLDRAALASIGAAMGRFDRPATACGQMTGAGQ